MLSKQEDAVMSAIYSLCDGTDGCIVSALEILCLVSKKSKITRDKLDDIIIALKCDGYFEVIFSERKQEKMYVINLKEGGFAYKRTAYQKRRDISFKILLALIGAVATFLFGLIIRSVFGG